MVKLRYCGNSPDPRDGSDERYMCFHNSYSPEAQLRHHRVWIKSMLIGDPQPCPAGDVEHMKSQGSVGLYRAEIDQYALDNPECIKDYDGPLERWTEFGWQAVDPLSMKVNINPFRLKNICSDCNGSGQYTGMNTVEACRACDGKGSI